MDTAAFPKYITLPIVSVIDSLVILWPVLQKILINYKSLNCEFMLLQEEKDIE